MPVENFPNPAVASRPATQPDGTAMRLPLSLLALLISICLAGAAHSRCIDEEVFDPAKFTGAGPGKGQLTANPRAAVQQLVRDTLLRSHGLGAARLMAEAAEQEVAEAKAAKLPQASLAGALEPSLTSTSLVRSQATAQVRAGVQVGQVMFDGGRSDRIIDWRKYQADASRLGLLSTQEQLSLTALSLAFERSRWRMQVVIYGQYVRKMSCLVEALESIVTADRGRTSELVLARKQVQQAELQQVQAQSQARLVEARLRRMAGDGLPSVDGMAALMMKVPELPVVLTAAEQSHEIAQLDANAMGMKAMAMAVEAGTRPQVSWNVSGSALVGGSSNTGSNHGATLSAGLAVSIPLLNPATDHTIQAARKRAEAARLQRADALESRRQRIVEVHEQATSAFDRLVRVGAVLKDSDRLRDFTLQQWQQLGRRSLFDVMSTEGDHYNLRVQYVNALHDGEQLNAMLFSLGTGLTAWLQ